MSYQIPPSLNVKPLPQCTYATTSTVFNSSSSIQKTLQSSSSLNEDDNVSEFGASLQSSFSGDITVATAQSMTTSSTQHIILTQLNCSTTYIEMDTDQIRFDPNFLNDLASIEQETDLFAIFKKYANRQTIGKQVHKQVLENLSRNQCSMRVTLSR
ncbi:hypothetical protein SAMD00019534_125170 [Acytostelium subglobosum LB1]|uniref:hypothetical protein n=1 Tax=Acytostelium subglobosum LB1 TaxID=1410327 RepID=UPI000644ABE4|nr:hypothetical protein SAMD00019534_125170 [Acytostelium subglobosum LB1]GAM29341.1 hypothetical protein SAMD00019534_125170 [Acytostelium subglobosum LB1]|eukprot:XP_012747721.1 hypothetical protein SAMD00019534_125170 [Acytostelium subglobosum LB1]